MILYLPLVVHDTFFVLFAGFFWLVGELIGEAHIEVNVGKFGELLMFLKNRSRFLKILYRFVVSIRKRSSGFNKARRLISLMPLFYGSRPKKEAIRTIRFCETKIIILVLINLNCLPN